MISWKDAGRIFLIFATIALMLGWAGAGMLHGVFGDEDMADLHENPAFVQHGEDGEHRDGPLAGLAFGSVAHAHAGKYCGHSARWVTINGVLHKQEFVRELSGPYHRIRAAHYRWTGTGYTRYSDWFYNTVKCH